MAYNKISIHSFNLDSKIENLKRKIIENEHKKILEHLSLLASGEITGKPIGDKRKAKLLDMFMIFFKNCKIPTDKLTIDDLRKFKEDLLNDRITKENGLPYSDETKEDCTETIVRYLEVTYPKKALAWKSKYQTFRKWFVIRASKKTPETLTEQEVKKLLNGCKSLEGKYIIAVLFDSGARIEEFLNIRFEDIEQPTNSFPYYKIDLKEEYSKTKGRKIGLYWEETKEIMLKYLASIDKRDMKEQVLNQTYDAVRMFLTRLSKKVLSKHVNPHMLRKTSASYYADKMNRQQLCYRFGWQFSSDMPDIYINRAMVEESRVKDVMLNDDISKQKKEIEALKNQIRKDREVMLNTNKVLEENKKIFDELIILKPYMEKLITNLPTRNKAHKSLMAIDNK